MKLLLDEKNALLSCSVGDYFMILNMKTCKKYVCDYGTLIDTEEMERKKKEEEEAANKDTGEEEEDEDDDDDDNDETTTVVVEAKKDEEYGSSSTATNDNDEDEVACGRLPLMMRRARRPEPPHGRVPHRAPCRRGRGSPASGGRHRRGRRRRARSGCRSA